MFKFWWLKVCYRGVPGNRLWYFRPWKFILVSDGIRTFGVQVDGGDGQKHQRMAPLSAQISTKASRLMVRVRVGVSKAFWGRFKAFYPWNFPS